MAINRYNGSQKTAQGGANSAARKDTRKPSILFTVEKEQDVAEGVYTAEIVRVGLNQFGDITIICLLDTGAEVEKTYDLRTQWRVRELSTLASTFLNVDEGEADLAELVGYECEVTVDLHERKDGSLYPLITQVRVRPAEEDVNDDSKE